MQQRLAEWHLKPELSEARRVREALASTMQNANAEHVDAFQLACAELIVNLSRYPDPKPTEIVLCLSKDDQYWWLELLDNGPSFSNFSQQINNPDTLLAAESGMGLKLLAQVFPDIRYIPACYREDARNLMLLRQPLNDQTPMRKTLLLVDDDLAYRAVISAYLNPDYHVIEAESVTQAYGVILCYRPDLVICDIKMPDQDGSALFDQIAHIPEVADTAFIYLSGCQDQVVISQALSRPIDDFLAKPVSRSELNSCVDRVIQRRGYLTEQIRHELEQKVTLGLHPSLPDKIPGYRLQLRSINPEPGGGDLVQLQRRGSDSMILLADLMGHGLSAKGNSYALAGYLRGLSSATCSQSFNLETLFSLLSRGFQEDTLLQQTLATIIAVQLTEDGRLIWANAGQPYPLHLTNEGAETIRTEGPLPGLGLDSYQTLHSQLLPGERVLIYSDGFLDAAKPLPDAFQKTIISSWEMPLSAAADAILTARLQLGRTTDDLTLILIEKC